ncbi:hypothetical protein ACSBO6_15005 [Bacillus sp. AL-1R]
MSLQLDKIFYHTSFVVICKSGFDEIIIERIIENNPLIKGKVEKKFDNIIFVTIFPTTSKQKKFEDAKIMFIYQVKEISEYISVVFDSQTQSYMQEISHSIYNLEREFRALIEIVFLKQKGKDWYKTFYQDNEKEKKRNENRPDVIKNLSNPLDSRDFVDLSNFVQRKINTSKNTILQKLEKIENLFEEYKEDNQVFLENIQQITFKLDEIKAATYHKNEGFTYNNLYEHLTPAMSNEWKELYQKRNLWAHNYCLFTLKELNRFRYLSNIVLRKVRTEITLLSILDDVDKPFIISGEIVTFNLHKMKSEGTTICKLKIRINIGNDDNRLIEFSKATYLDIIKISQVLAKFARQEDEHNLLENICFNPFLSEILKQTIIKIINSVEFKDRISSEFEELEKSLESLYFNILNKEGIKPTIKKINKVESKMDEDLNILLQQIFQE